MTAVQCHEVTGSPGHGRGSQNLPDGDEERAEGWAAPSLGPPFCTPAASARSTRNFPYWHEVTDGSQGIPKLLCSPGPEAVAPGVIKFGSRGAQLLPALLTGMTHGPT